MAQLKVKQISDFVSAVEGKINGMVGTSVSDAISSAVSGASSTLSTGLSNEVSRATAAEGTLSSAIVGVAGDLSSYEVSNDAALSAEVSRATAAEGTLSSAISAEVSNRSIAVSGVTSSLNAEISRASDAEGVLSSAISAEVSNRSIAVSGVTSSLNAEISRASAAEGVLDGKIDTEKGRIDAILAAANADYDTFVEIVALINSVDTTNDNALATAILDINDAIDAEATARQNADDALGVRIDGLTTASTTAISDAVLVEKNRAEAAEGLLAGDISSLQTDLGTAESNITTLQNELDAAESNISTLQTDLDNAESDINNEVNNRREADDALGVRIDDEEAARITADNGLSDRINSLDSAAQGYADDAEVAAIASANGYTDGEIDTLSTAVAAVTDGLGGRLTTAESDITALEGKVATLEGQDIVQKVGVYETATEFRVDAPFVTGDLGLKVFINGLQIHAEASGDGYTTDGSRFTLVNLGYAIDANDHIIVLGVLA